MFEDNEIVFNRYRNFTAMFEELTILELVAMMTV